MTALENAARKVFKLYGVQELRIPTVELKELFVKSTGTTTDIVQKEMYAFEASHHTVALRPEGTPGVVRAYIENNFSQAEPVQQFFYIGNMFRAERPQTGRYREFEQIGAELIGNSAPAADAQAILMLKDIMLAFGVKNYKVKINSLGCPKCRPQYREKLFAYLSQNKQELCEVCKDRLERNPLRVLDCKIDGAKFAANAPKMELCPECQEHFDMLKKLLAGKIEYEVDPCLVRGLDYYTRTVFEFQAGNQSQNAIAAGGRYDTLIQSMGGAPMPAVGWALGAERTCLALGQYQPKKQTKVFVVCLEKPCIEYSFNIMQSLRKERRMIITEGGLFDRNVKTQMRQADRTKADFAVIIGGNEMAANGAALKDLTTGKQAFFNFDDLKILLKEKICIIEVFLNIKYSVNMLRNTKTQNIIRKTIKEYLKLGCPPCEFQQRINEELEKNNVDIKNR